jgi:hypothetical protein
MKSFLELKRTLKEAAQGKLPDPPPMIVLKRRGIRIFPNGLKVALYHNDLLNLDVSVPYTPKQVSINKAGTIPFAAVREEVIYEDTRIVKRLENIVKNGSPGSVVFDNGASVMVQPNVASRILKLQSHKDLKPSYKKKLSDYINTSPKEFKKVVDFTTANEQ